MYIAVGKGIKPSEASGAVAAAVEGIDLVREFQVEPDVIPVIRDDSWLRTELIF